MPSETPTNTSQEWAPNSLEPIEQLAHWLTSAAVHGAIGVAIGLIAVRLMHHRHLRWTWAPTALGVDLLLSPVLGGSVAWTVGIAALCATVRGHRWHREEDRRRRRPRRAGGEPARTVGRAAHVRAP